MLLNISYEKYSTIVQIVFQESSNWKDVQMKQQIINVFINQLSQQKYIEDS